MGRRQEPLRLRALTAAHVGPAGGLPRDKLARARRKSPRGIRLSHCTGYFIQGQAKLRDIHIANLSFIDYWIPYWLELGRNYLILTAAKCSFVS